MQRRLDQLQAECQKLGLTVRQTGKRPAKDDYIRALRAHFMPAEGLPYTELQPMLCFPVWQLKPEEAEHRWTSPSWIAQRKLNGCRIILHFVKGVGVFAHSRTTSLKNYRMQELTPKLLFNEYVPEFSATLDAEAIVEKAIDTRGYTAKGEVTKTTLHSTICALHLEPAQALRLQREQAAPLTIHVFDVTSRNGQDLRMTPLAGRLTVLSDMFRNELRCPSGWTAEQAAKAGIKEPQAYLRYPTYTAQDKRGFFERTLKEGGEGVILKNLSSPYIDSSSRSRDAWVKVKRRVEFDAFVTGFLRGEPDTAWKNLVGALEFSVIDEKSGKLHPIAMCSNLTLENRQKITVYDAATDKVTLHPSMYGKVAEVSGQDVTARVYRLSHATVDKWRKKDGPDAKRKEDCTVDLDEVKARADWNE
jgi:ATP-dependent DNA ligase